MILTKRLFPNCESFLVVLQRFAVFSQMEVNRADVVVGHRRVGVLNTQDLLLDFQCLLMALQRLAVVAFLVVDCTDVVVGQRGLS